MNKAPELISSIKDSYILIEVRTPFERDGELYPWCINHVSEGHFKWANRFSGGGNLNPLYWFELEADAMLFKLRFG